MFVYQHFTFVESRISQKMDAIFLCGKENLIFRCFVSDWYMGDKLMNQWEIIKTNCSIDEAPISIVKIPVSWKFMIFWFYFSSFSLMNSHRFLYQLDCIYDERYDIEVDSENLRILILPHIRFFSYERT